MDYDRLLARIPNQSGPQVGRILRDYAAEVPATQAIVELGVWLGYGTAWLRLGADPGVQVHGYDVFRAHKDGRHKAGKQGLILAPQADTLPIVARSLEPFGCVHLHKGHIGDARWAGPRIGLYVDDANKDRRHFERALSIFAPWWVPGRTIVVLQDFYYFKRTHAAKHRGQYEWMAEHAECFQQILGPGVHSVAGFRYLGGRVV